jgi:biopolymer transport protein ExbD
LKLALPESTQALKTGANEVAPFLVSVDSKGMLRLGPEAIAITADELKQRLIEQAGKNPDLKVAISADKEAPVGQLVKVWDATKAAHIKAVSMFVKEAAKP